jgi:Type I phosphodiesterase / nucleotide pyrophosphatase
MSDVEGLLAAFSVGELARPSSAVPNIIDLSRALVWLAGAEDVEASAGSTALASMIGPSEHLVFVLVDGLGLNLLERLPANAFLSKHLATELRTVFPSTTAVAVTSLATSQWPNQHAVTGWWTHLPEVGASATILQFVKRSDQKSLRYHGLTLEQAFPAPSIMSKIARDTLALFPDKVGSSVYSTYFCGGKPRQSYRNLQEAVDITIKRVQSAGCPTYTYIYTSRIDDEAHRCGLGRPEVQAALFDMNRELERLAGGVGGRGRIVVSADHGFLDAGRPERHQIRWSDQVMSYLRFPPSGDARVMYLHMKEGAEFPIRQYFQRRFGERFLLITVDEAEELQLLGPGPISAEAKRRVGDLILISRGRDVIEYRPPGGNTGRIMSEASQHSGLTPAEMRVPLVVV